MGCHYSLRKLLYCCALDYDFCHLDSASSLDGTVISGLHEIQVAAF